MTKQRPPAWAACLLLLAACGQDDSPANNSVTVKVPPAAGAPLAPESSYTSIEPASCKAIGDSNRRCGGSGDYALETSRQGVAIIAPDGRRSALDLSKRGTKGGPKLGAKAEWRGPAPGYPNVLIVRVGLRLPDSNIPPAWLRWSRGNPARMKRRARSPMASSPPASSADA